MVLTPGVEFLLRLLLYLLGPPLLSHFSLKLLPLSISSGLQVLICVLSLPALLWLRSLWHGIVEARQMKALGAQPVPVIRGKWPGNLDYLIARLKAGEDGYPHDGLQPVARKYGNIFNLRVLGQNRIVTTEPEHMKTILATEFENWEKGNRFRKQFGSVLGTGVFSSDGEMWKFHRTMTRPFFARDRVTDFDIFERHSKEALDIISSLHRKPFDFQDLVFRLTLDTAVQFLYGSTTNSLHELGILLKNGQDQKSGSMNKFGDALTAVQRQLGQRSRLVPIWPLFEIFEDKTKKDMDIIHNFIDPIIQEALVRKKSRAQGVSESALTLLDHLVEVTDDMNMIVDETINMLVAGRETTAATIAYVVYCLAINPPVMDRLRMEIVSRLGTNACQPTIDDLREMRFLRAVIQETLRLFPPVPGNVRSPIKPATLPASKPGEKPYFIPKGVKVPFSVMGMQRRTDLWGPDAETYDPDRFLDERLNKYIVSNPFVFIPFNAGPRICLGQQFAMHEVSYFIIRLLQTFEHIELALEAQPADSLPPASWKKGPGRKAIEKIRPRSEITMSIHGGLWVKMW